MVDNLLRTGTNLGVPGEIIANQPAEIHWAPYVQAELPAGAIPFIQIEGNPGRTEIQLTPELLRGYPPKILTDQEIRSKAIALINLLLSQPERENAIVIAHHYIAGTLASMAKNISSFPLVYIPHNMHIFTDTDSWSRIARRHSLESARYFTRHVTIPIRNSNLIIFPTEAEITIFREKMGDGIGGSSLAPYLDYTVHVPWGVDHKIFNKGLRSKENKIKSRERLQIPKDALVFGFNGRIHPVKNIELIIDAFDELTRAYPNENLYFALIGGESESLTNENSYLSSLQQRIDSKNNPQLARNLRFFGPRFPQTFLPAVDVMVQPSHYESWGLSVTEAMACGIPVVVSDTPIMREVTGNGQKYISPSDSKTLTQAMEDFLKTPELITSQGNIAHKIAANYQWETSFLTLLSHLRQQGLSKNFPI